MATSPTRTRRRTRIGPRDHGRMMTRDELDRARERSGYVYELIDGALNVSPSPKPNHEIWKETIREALRRYGVDHPDRINFVATEVDVVIPGRSGPTRPRPDVSAYQGFPHQQALDGTIDWDDLCPIVVAEIVSRRRPRKDTMRNRNLYWLAGGIVEYWILDPRKDAHRPKLTVCRRVAGRPDWEEANIPPGGRYSPPFLPGMTLVLEQ